MEVFSLSQVSTLNLVESVQVLGQDSPLSGHYLNNLLIGSTKPNNRLLYIVQVRPSFSAGESSSNLSLGLFEQLVLSSECRRIYFLLFPIIIQPVH